MQLLEGDVKFYILWPLPKKVWIYLVKHNIKLCLDAYPKTTISKIMVNKIENLRRTVNIGKLKDFVPPSPETKLPR